MKYTLEAKLGEMINRYAERLISYWDEMYKTDDLAIVEGKFNECNFIVDGKSTSQKLVHKFNLENKKAAKAYRKTKEYILQQRKNKKEVEKNQKTEHVLFKHMKKIDYSDSGKVLDWVMEYYKATNHIDVKNNFKKVHSELVRHGYKSKANTGENFNKEDRDNVGRYIIGQFMDCARFGKHCPEIIQDFYDEYSLNFVFGIPKVEY